MYCSSGIVVQVIISNYLTLSGTLPSSLGLMSALTLLELASSII